MKYYMACFYTVFALVVMTGCEKRRQDLSVPDEIPVYGCRQASGPILIDGNLDEPAWQDVEVIDTFYPYDPEFTGPLSGTKVRLTWDPNHLYVAIECVDDDIWSFSDEPDSELWLGDVVEIFLKPSASKLSYCEFVIAPNGTLFDARFPSRGAGGYRRFSNWSSNAEVATEIDGSDGDWRDTDTGYTVEMAIPFSAFKEVFGVPLPGDVWTFGVFRYDYSKSYEKQLLMMSIPDAPEYGFHYYEKYHHLEFR